MNLDTITKGEELLKKATPGKWNGICIEYILLEGYGGRQGPGWNDDAFALFLINHASELLQCAREVEELKARIRSLENPLPTQEEEREFYHRAYHICHTGCTMPCPSKVLYVDPKRT